MAMTLTEHECPDGGILRECYKDPAWGQVNLRTIPPGQSKPGHVHHRRNERWVLVRGENVWVTVEQSGWPVTFPLALWRPMTLEAGTGHAVDNRGKDEAVLIFWMDEVYDPEDPDKEPWGPG